MQLPLHHKLYICYQTELSFLIMYSDGTQGIGSWIHFCDFQYLYLFFFSTKPYSVVRKRKKFLASEICILGYTAAACKCDAGLGLIGFSSAVDKTTFSGHIGSGILGLRFTRTDLPLNHSLPLSRHHPRRGSISDTDI